MRKSIARVLTVINQNKKQAVREAYADKVRSPPGPAGSLFISLVYCCSLPVQLGEVGAQGRPCTSACCQLATVCDPRVRRGSHVARAPCQGAEQEVLVSQVGKQVLADTVVEQLTDDLVVRARNGVDGVCAREVKDGAVECGKGMCV